MEGKYEVGLTAKEMAEVSKVAGEGRIGLCKVGTEPSL